MMSFDDNKSLLTHKPRRLRRIDETLIIPMAFVTDGTVAQSLRVETQSSSNNNNHRVVAEFNYYMGPETVDSPSCLPH
jgi:hypothetical protein